MTTKKARAGGIMLSSDSDSARSRKDLVKDVDLQLASALDPMVRWALDHTRVGEDDRFEAHGTERYTTGYREFTRARTRVRYERGLTCEEDCRAVPSDAGIKTNPAKRKGSSSQKMNRNRSQGGGLGLGRPLFRMVSYYDTRSYNCRDIPSQSPGSLKLLFQYYCKLLTPSGVNTGLNKGTGLTYDLIQVANDTMSLTELMIFASDFHLVPTIISHSGIHFCWQRQRVGRHELDDSPTELDYRSFVEVLVRIALIAFAHLVDPKDRVYELANYLALWETEKYEKTIEGLEISRRGNTRATKGLAERAAINNGDDESETSSDGEDSTDDEQQRKGSLHESKHSESKCGDAKPRRIKSAFSQIRKQSNRPPKPWERLHCPVAAQSNEGKKGRADRGKSSSAALSSHGQINFDLVDTRRTKWKKIDVDNGYFNKREKELAMDLAKKKKKKKKKSFQSTVQVNRRRKKFWDADSLFDKSLLCIYDEYEFENGRVRSLPFDEEFLDMGVLAQGSRHKFRIVVQNVSRNSLEMDVVLSSNLAGVSVRFDARQMPMGIKRQIDVDVHCIDIGEIVGHISVHAYDKEGTKQEDRNFPVYYHVVPANSLKSKACPVMSTLGTLPLAAESRSSEEDNLPCSKVVGDDEWARCASPSVARPEQALARDPSKLTLSCSPLEVGKATSAGRPSSAVIAGLSLPSPTRRILVLDEEASPDLQRFPLPVSLMPQRKGHKSLVTKRASLKM